LLSSNQLEYLLQLMRQDREQLVDELIQNHDPERTANIRGRIQYIDEVISTYPDRILNKQ